MKRSRRLFGPQYVEPVWLWTDRIHGAWNGSSGRKEEVNTVAQPVELENKVALIVSGANDKGYRLAAAFAERGMDVALIYFGVRDEEAKRAKQQIEAAGRRCLLLRGEGKENLDQDAFARWAVERITETFGRLDLFINVSEKRFSLGALNGDASGAGAADAATLFPQFRIMKAALDEIVS